jgi:hypothetical protein
MAKLLRAKVMVVLLRSLLTAKVAKLLTAMPAAMPAAKAVAEAVAEAAPMTKATAKAATFAKSSAPLAKARVLTEALAKAVPKMMLSTAGTSLHVLSGRAALRAVEALAATRTTELATMPKELLPTAAEAPAKAAVLTPLRPLLVLETMMPVAVLSASLRLVVHRAWMLLRLRATMVVPFPLLAIHGRTAEAAAPLVLVVATVAATGRLHLAAPSLILRGQHGGAWAGALLGGAHSLRTRGAAIARAFGAWRIAALRCGSWGRCWWRALGSGLGRRRRLVGRLGILGGKRGGTECKSAAEPGDAVGFWLHLGRVCWLSCPPVKPTQGSRVAKLSI